MNYRIFDTHLLCNVPLPGLPEWQGLRPDVSVIFEDGPGVELNAFNWIHSWKNPQEEVTLACGRRGDNYLLHFPEVAKFHVQSREGRITAWLEDPAQRPEAIRLLVDQVIPRYLFHLGHVVLHASSAELESGAAIAFLGSTGRGKSTLAASFHLSGGRLVSDDSLLLRSRGSGIVGIPAYSGFRLWPDSFEALGLGAIGGDLSDLANGKCQFTLRQPETPVQPTQLAAVFLLGDPVGAPHDGSVACNRVRGSEVMMAMIEAAFVLDLVSADAVRRNFSALGAIARLETPVYSLNFERRHELLPNVMAVIKRQLATQKYRIFENARREPSGIVLRDA